jgi:DNA-directed RNA polymerase specialized sigma24 family protein
MTIDPAITEDDLHQEYCLKLFTQGAGVSKATFVRRRNIDAIRRYSRCAAAVRQRGQDADNDPITQLIADERKQLLQKALSRATHSQQQIARMCLDGHRACEIAALLHISKSAVTHALQRLRPLLAGAR